MSTLDPPPTSIVDARRMLVEYAPLRLPLASGLIFDWCVTEANYMLEPRVIKAQFGDGYAQRRPAGINTQACLWQLAMKNTDARTAGTVVQFLSARNGVEVFNWMPPRQIGQSAAQDVICPSWSVTYGELLQDGSLLYNLSFKFEQVFL